ncbi:MAG: hypothetical protein HQK49_06885 [Oligoflexia bacterium]|nr:hypothetical protein [Oligoflexia bacterium]
MKQHQKKIKFIILFFMLINSFLYSNLLFASNESKFKSKIFLPELPKEKQEKLKEIFFSGMGSEDKTLPNIQNPFEMEVTMEEVDNVPEMCQGTETVQAPVVTYPFHMVDMDLDKSFPDDLLNCLKVKSGRGHRVLFPIHPLNTDPKVAGQTRLERWRKKNKAKLQFMPMRNLASRSKVGVPEGVNPFGIKLGTNFVKENIYQPCKAEMKLDGQYGRARTNYMEKVDKLIGEEKDCKFLKELGYISLKKSEEGYLIRDLTPLQDGNIYVPLLSIPYVGTEIAKYKNESFEDFWGREFADAMGRCKAKHLLRYGLQMLTPNSQNMLKRFDTDLNPKEIIYRDNSDSHFVDVVSKVISPLIDKNIGVQDGGYTKDKDWGNVIDSFIHPYSSNTTWRMDEGPRGINANVLDNWNKRQIVSYIKTINQELGANIVPFNSSNDNDNEVNEFEKKFIEKNKGGYVEEPDWDDLPYITAVQKFFESQEGKKKLKDYYQNLIDKQKELKKGKTGFKRKRDKAKEKESKGIRKRKKEE